MAKISSKDVIGRIKQREKSETRSNYTFRLNDDLMAQLKERCGKQDVSMASVLEELIEAFLKA